MDVGTYREQGYGVARGALDLAEVEEALRAVRGLLGVALARAGLLPSPREVLRLGEPDLLELLVQLYQQALPLYVAALRHVPFLLPIQRLGVCPAVVERVRALGLAEPICATPPIAYFLSERLALPGDYHRAPPHQDWRYALGSLDLLTVWIPLVDVDAASGAVEVIPGSHLGGLLPTLGAGHVQRIRPEHLAEQAFVPLELARGDVAMFSGFTVHRSGVNRSDHMRWAVAYRFNNLAEPSFARRDLPCLWALSPQLDAAPPDFPAVEDLTAIFGPAPSGQLP